MASGRFHALDRDARRTAAAWLGIAGGILVLAGYVTTLFWIWVFFGPYVRPEWTFYACCGAPHVVIGFVAIALGARALSGRLHPAGLGIAGVIALPLGLFFLGGLPTFFGGVTLLFAGLFASAASIGHDPGSAQLIERFGKV